MAQSNDITKLERRVEELEKQAKELLAALKKSEEKVQPAPSEAPPKKEAPPKAEKKAPPKRGAGIGLLLVGTIAALMLAKS